VLPAAYLAELHEFDCSPLLDVLGDLLTALCALSWLSALYALTAAFLHFFLFFALSLPFTHLLDEAVLLAPNGGPGKDAAQAEVDIRVRTERPPYEAYHWVWWGWYGHRRAPVGHLYSVFVTVLALSSVSSSNVCFRGTRQREVEVG